MRRIASISAALVLALAAGCGGDEEGEPIPAQNARALLQQLDGIESQVEIGRCGSATFQIRDDGQLQDKIAALPDSVDADLRSALEDSADRLLRLVEDECGQDEEPTDTTETEPPQTEETEPPETQETEETQPPETQEEEPPPTEEEPPPTETIPPPDQGEPPLPAPGAGGARGTR